jgi:hypothetical protein
MPPQYPGQRPKKKKPSRSPSAAGQDWTRWEDGSSSPPATAHKAVKKMRTRPTYTQKKTTYSFEGREHNVHGDSTKIAQKRRELQPGAVGRYRVGSRPEIVNLPYEVGTRTAMSLAKGALHKSAAQRTQAEKVAVRATRKRRKGY